MLAKQYKDVTDPVFPSVKETLELLKDYCRENNIPIGEDLTPRIQLADIVRKEPT